MYNNSKDVKKLLIDNCYVIPRGERSDAVKKAIAEKKGIYAFYDGSVRKPKEEGEKEEKEQPKKERAPRKNAPVQQSMDLKEKNNKLFLLDLMVKKYIIMKNHQQNMLMKLKLKLKVLRKNQLKKKQRMLF